MGTISGERLIAACGDDSSDAGIVLAADLVPVAGDGAPVKPAVYEGGHFQQDRRWSGDGAQRAAVQVIVIDNAASQANRLEAQLEMLRDRLGLPDLVLDLDSVGPLPPHLPRRISALRFPHRNADAYLRDAQLDGKPFASTDVGRALFAATAEQPVALFQWMPQALLFGFWQSHLGKKASQAKLARSWVSEVVGFEPATVNVRTLGTKGDPLNLSIQDAIEWNEADQTSWRLTGAEKAAKKKAADSLAEIGHGQVPFRGSESAPAGVSFRSLAQRASVSFAGLRRIRTGDGDADATGRALLVALGLVAHVAAFGRSFSLRSGCDLRPRPGSTRWTWLGGDDDEPVTPLTLSEAVVLFQVCVEAARGRGLPVGSDWPSPLVLQPQEKLGKVIAKTWPPLDEE